MSRLKSYPRLLQKVATSGARIVGIDGYSGSGKTTIAEQLSGDLGYPVIHLDSQLLPENMRRHAFDVDIERFRKLLGGLLSTNRVVIIEGVTLLDVLLKADIQDVFIVYLKHLEKYGTWEDRSLCDLRFKPVEAIKRWNKNAYGSLSELNIQLTYYHHDYKPTKRAELIFCVTH